MSERDQDRALAQGIGSAGDGRALVEIVVSGAVTRPASKIVLVPRALPLA